MSFLQCSRTDFACISIDYDGPDKDTNLAIGIEWDGDVVVEMNPNGNTKGSIKATFGTAQVNELVLWYLKTKLHPDGVAALEEIAFRLGVRLGDLDAD